MSALDVVLDVSLVTIQHAVIAYFAFANGIYLLALVAAAWELLWHAQEVLAESRARLLSSELAPRISVLVPAFNEEASIRDSVAGLLTLDYRDLEVVVVDDGSTDATLALLVQTFELEPVAIPYEPLLEVSEVRQTFRSRRHSGLVVVAKVNGGKADALNVGLCVASGELVCAVDADSVLAPDALQRLVRPFLASNDTLGAGGSVRVANGCTVRHGRVIDSGVPSSWLARQQTVEYLRAFMFGRAGNNRIGGNVLISGALGLFPRTRLIGVGGYQRSMAEDMELTMRLRRRARELGEPDHLVFVPDAVSFTQVPESLRVLGRQRMRWQGGCMESLIRHRRMFLNRRYGVLGMFTFPTYALVEGLAPIAEAVGILTTVVGLANGSIAPPTALLFVAVTYGLAMLLSVGGMLLEELYYRSYGSVGDRVRLLAAALTEMFWYHPLTLLWRLRGLVLLARGRVEWGVIERAGFRTGDDAARST